MFPFGNLVNSFHSKTLKTKNLSNILFLYFKYLGNLNLIFNQ